MKKDRVQRTKTGRRTKLTPAVQQTITDAMEAGTPFESACRLAGVSPTTGHEWRQRGAAMHPRRTVGTLYAEFAEAIARARAQDEARRVLRINQAGQGGTVTYERTVEKLNEAGEVGARITEVQYSPPDWRAAAWHLERAYPDQWGRRERVDVQRTIQRIAAKVASEASANGTPMTAEEVIAEAQRLLDEADREAQEGQ